MKSCLIIGAERGNAAEAKYSVGERPEADAEAKCGGDRLGIWLS